MDNTQHFAKWITDNNIALPNKTSEDDIDGRKIELEAVQHIANQFNAANVREYTEFQLGELSLSDLFGPVEADEILNKFEVVAQNSSVFKRLLKHLGPDAKGINIGNEHATLLLNQLLQLNIINQTQLNALNNKRTFQVIISDNEAWNYIHTR